MAVKSKVEISKNLVAFSEYMNFKQLNETVDNQLSFRNLLKSEELDKNVFGSLVTLEYEYT